MLTTVDTGSDCDAVEAVDGVRATQPVQTAAAERTKSERPVFGVQAGDRTRGLRPTDPRAPRPPQGVPTGARAPMQLWAVAAALAVLASTVAMSRIGVLPFSILSFAAKPKATVVVLDHEVPYGKGMWIYEPDKSDGGNANAIVTRAKAVGLSHIYVRTGSSWDGFYAAPFLDAILPAAHAAGIRVYGWDFPRLIDVQSDVNRALAAIDHIGPGGNRLDGFAADIETPSEGTAISADAATAYGDGLRAGVGAGYPLIACVPRPSPWTKSFYPYVEVVSQFDAIAPMVYWLNRQPDTDVAGAMSDLAPMGKPVFPVGQAFDGGPEGGRPGLPTPDELDRFMVTAKQDGAQGVSFWSWQAADQQTWDTIKDGPLFKKQVTTVASVATVPPRPQPLLLQAG